MSLLLISTELGMRKSENIRKFILVGMAAGILFLIAITGFFFKDVVKREVIFRRMNLRQKITQTFMMDFRTWNGENLTELNDEVAEIISDYDFGSVILFSQNMKSAEDVYSLTNDLQKAATDRHGVPLLIATDQEGGMVYRLSDGTAMCGNMALTATNDPNNAYLTGSLIGSELKAVGINVNLAPVADVNNNANNPVIGLRSFSDDAGLVSEYALQYEKGLTEQNVIPCMKHFPGHGNTDVDSHYGLPTVTSTLDELMDVELKPYQDAIAASQDMIMTAHILYPEIDSSTVYSEKTGKEESRPATMSEVMLTDVLRNQLGYEGVICTDAMNMEGISTNFDEGQAVVEALSAGADIICMPVTGINETEDLVELDRVIDRVVKAVETGELSKKRLNDAVRRILILKEKYGILDYSNNKTALNDAMDLVGGSEHRQTEREISAKAVTVIRNDGDVLPLKAPSGSRTLILTAYENECGQVAVAWNRAIKEQVISDRAEVDIISYSEEDFITETTETEDTTTEESEREIPETFQGLSARLCERIDEANQVVVFSEINSAEKMDYRTWQSAIPYYVTSYAKQNNKPSVVMSVNKPYDIQLYPDADGVMCVYGCKGSTVDVTEALLNVSTETKTAAGPNIIAGIEVMLGTFPAGGILPIEIPEYDEQTKSFGPRVIYERGYGLTYPEAAKSIFVDTDHTIGDTIQEEPTRVILGDEQSERYLPYLTGQRVALFSNQSGIVGDRNTMYSSYELSNPEDLDGGWENLHFGTDETGKEIDYGMHILDALLEQNVDVTAVFSPEHGFRGNSDAGASVNDSVDEKTGVPILSLYSGNSHYPSAEDMEKFDTLVIDIQDVGLRYYTYYISMYYLIDACAQYGKRVVVLDRPNPNGFYVDGPVLKDDFKSGVGRLPIPIVHGMTLGELAQMMNGEGWLESGVNSCNLTVISCENYSHATRYSLVKRPSPNLKNMRAIYLYASTCFFENTVVSVGRGTEMPFEVFGSPYYKGVEKYSYSFIPKSMDGAKNPPQEGQTCYGLDLSEIPVEQIWEEGIQYEYLIDAYNTLKETNPSVNFWGNKDKNGHYWIDLLMGTDSVRLLIEQGADAGTIKASYEEEVSQFLKQRQPYLLYE